VYLSAQYQQYMDQYKGQVAQLTSQVIVRGLLVYLSAQYQQYMDQYKGQVAQLTSQVIVRECWCICQPSTSSTWTGTRARWLNSPAR